MSVESAHRTTVTVTGMTCEHCVRAVTEELSALDGVHEVDVALSSGLVTVTSSRELSGTEIAEAVEEAGYELAG
ncbi:MAG TPA: heavy metal-associated domain-containing protein [Pseudonocardia sp.]|jgi:copper ion binding protein